MDRSLPCLLVVIAACALAQGQSTQPFTYKHEVRENPPNHLHVVTIDLTNPQLSIHVARAGSDPDGNGRWTTTLQTVRSMAERDDLDIAVNGDFFFNGETRQLFGQLIKYPQGSPAAPCGPAMSDGMLWNMGPGTMGVAMLTVDKQGAVRIGMGKRSLPAATVQVTSGNLIAADGKALHYRDAVAPHTAVGIDRDAKMLTILVVDGRRPEYSAGMTRDELADEMVKRGCWTVLALDGGGSSTLVMRDKAGKVNVVNRPSDGYQAPIPVSIERPVASALGFRFRKATTAPAVTDSR